MIPSRLLKDVLEDSFPVDDEDGDDRPPEGPEDMTPRDNSEDGDQEIKNLTKADIDLIKNSNPHDVIKLIDSLVGGQRDEQNISSILGKKARVSEAEIQAVAYQYDTLGDDEAIPPEIPTAESSYRPCEATSPKASFYLELSKVVPIRLTHAERRILRLLESTLEVSEYTDRIDIFCGGSKARRISREIKQLCAILSGLAIAHNYEDGQKLIKTHDYAENAEFFKAVFEIGRRYKILNPDRMRSSYGKLMYVLMDSRKYDIQQLLDFDCVAPVQTVFRLLESRKNGLALLSDPLITIATMEIMPEGKSKAQIQKEIRRKEAALKELCRVHASGSMPKKNFKFFGLNFGFFNRFVSSSDDDTGDESTTDGLQVDDIEQCVYSLGDFNSYIRFSREPCDVMIRYLKEYFHHIDVDERFNLAISAGLEGARLTHSHSRQYIYVLQSLTLWREIANEMFHLWHCAERDMLDTRNPYILKDTGQGLNRVQDAPRVEQSMQRILMHVQHKVGGWVGSSVMHHGDYNVPNSLMFIDKYTQVPRILTPIVSCLERVSELKNSTPAMQTYIEKQFGGVHHIRKMILCDFFRHAFDGSGAENYMDAGSCIDGRLTSAWNWCNNIEKKPYFPIFLLTGFCGFDGKF